MPVLEIDIALLVSWKYLTAIFGNIFPPIHAIALKFQLPVTGIYNVSLLIRNCWYN